MADFTAFASILSSVKTATEIAKLLKKSDLSLEKAEMKLRLADLIKETKVRDWGSGLASCKKRLQIISDFTIL